MPSPLNPEDARPQLSGRELSVVPPPAPSPNPFLVQGDREVHGSSLGSQLLVTIKKQQRLLLLAALAAAGLWAVFGGGPSDSDSPMYDKHKSPLRPALTISQADIDMAATKRAIAALNAGRMVPETANLTPEAQKKVMAGKAALIRLHLFDTCAEDGDIVAVSVSTARSADVRLTNAGTEVFVPFERGTLPQVMVHALKDGQGGVTVGVTAADGTWFSSVIPEGGAEQVALQGR